MRKVRKINIRICILYLSEDLKDITVDMWRIQDARAVKDKQGREQVSELDTTKTAQEISMNDLDLDLDE